jgi:hypothetical protein
VSPCFTEGRVLKVEITPVDVKREIGEEKVHDAAPERSKFDHLSGHQAEKVL